MAGRASTTLAKRLLVAVTLGMLFGCAHRGAPIALARWSASGVGVSPCSNCALLEEAERVNGRTEGLPVSGELRGAIESRISDLKSRGGACGAYGRVLEQSLETGRIAVRPYMWRVGPRRASAQAHADGEIIVARDIDSLNVGVRTLADVIRSVEHEAAHLAFSIPSGQESHEVSVDGHVAECRPRGS
jgi:hypothetical protein